ncbi:hypothetical protein FF1_036609 [Malus domestica]
MARASLVSVVVVLLVTVGIIPHANCCYTSIIGSGDSLVNTGNTYTNVVDRKIDLLSWLQPPASATGQLRGVEKATSPRNVRSPAGK